MPDTDVVAVPVAGLPVYGSIGFAVATGAVMTGAGVVAAGLGVDGAVVGAGCVATGVVIEAGGVVVEAGGVNEAVGIAAVACPLSPPPQADRLAAAKRVAMVDVSFIISLGMMAVV
jgi:hypothetical protein